MTEKYYNELLPLDLYKEAFVQFYGERHRQKIEGLFRNTNFILVPKGLESYKFKKHIKQNFPQLNGVETLNITLAVMGCHLIINGDLSRVGTSNNQQIFEKLGLMKFFTKNEQTNQYEWANESAKTQFSEFCAKLLGQCDYNKLCMEEGIRSGNQLSKENFVNQIGRYAAVKLTLEFVEECRKDHELTKDCGIPAAQILNPLENLDNKALANLSDLLFSKNPIDFNLESKESEKFVLNVMKECFGVEVSSIEECENDPRLKNVIKKLKDYQAKVRNAENEMMTEEQKQFIDEMVELQNLNKKNEEAKLSHSTAEHYYKSFFGDNGSNGKQISTSLDVPPLVAYPVYGDLSLGTILHELNHLVQTHKIKPDSNALDSGFDVNHNSVSALENGKAKDKRKYEYLNEIVNEYLTKEIMKDVVINGELGIDKNFPLEIENSSCSYNRGVELFKPFLDKFKETLKQAVICNDPMVFRDKILGAKNFDKLAEFANTYLSADEPKYLMELSNMLGKQINSSQDIIAYKNEISKLKLSGNLSKFVDSVEKCHKLSQKCVHNHDKLIRGEKINMVGEWENEFTFDQTKENDLTLSFDEEK